VSVVAIGAALSQVVPVHFAMTGHALDDQVQLGLDVWVMARVTADPVMFAIFQCLHY
jgi:hypothetical protein